eukprot:scaffold45929_cov26-Tisochrysis_lutea.AAC.5
MPRCQTTTILASSASVGSGGGAVGTGRVDEHLGGWRVGPDLDRRTEPDVAGLTRRQGLALLRRREQRESPLVLELARLFARRVVVRVADTRICARGEQSHDGIRMAVTRGDVERCGTSWADDVHHVRRRRDEPTNRLDVAVMTRFKELPTPWVDRTLGLCIGGRRIHPVALPYDARLAGVNLCLHLCFSQLLHDGLLADGLFAHGRQKVSTSACRHAAQRETRAPAPCWRASVLAHRGRGGQRHGRAAVEPSRADRIAPQCGAAWRLQRSRGKEGSP